MVCSSRDSGPVGRVHTGTEQKPNSRHDRQDFPTPNDATTERRDRPRTPRAAGTGARSLNFPSLRSSTGDREPSRCPRSAGRGRLRLSMWEASGSARCGQQTLPTHGHLVTQRAGTGGTRQPRQCCPRPALAGQGAGPSVLRVRDPRALPAGPTGGPMTNGGGAGLITVRQVPATAARESNL